MLKCGFYETDITSFIGSQVPGGFKISTLQAIDDPLRAHAFALKASGEAVIIISLDAIAVEECDSAAIRSGISKATGIPFKNISVAAVHIHSGGPSIDLYESRRDEAYCEFMVRRAVDAGIMAYRNMKEARIGFTSCNVEGISFNRRFYMKDGSVKMNPGFLNPDIVKPADIIDPEFVVVRVDNADGTPMGIITNFALHLASTDDHTHCSSDYPGQICKHLRKHYGENLGFLSLTGCCGNINHLDFTRSREEFSINHKIIGAKLAEAAIGLIDSVETKDTDIVECTSYVFAGHTRRPTLEECLKETDYFIMTEMLRALELPEEDINIEVWSVRVGDDVIHMLPGEVFARFGMEIKKNNTHGHTLVAELSNFNIGYIYTKEACMQGGYEATPSTYIKMNSDVGYNMIDAADLNLKKLFDEFKK